MPRESGAKFRMIFPKTELDDRVAKDGTGHNDEGKNINKERQPGHTNQFTMVAFNNITDPEWRRRHRCSLACYSYIAHKAVRAPGKHDGYDLYNRYFEDNKLAAAAGVRELANAFGYKQTGMVRDWIKELEQEGAFIIDNINVPGKPEPANIYILGYYTPKEFVLYYGNVRIPRKD